MGTLNPAYQKKFFFFLFAGLLLFACKKDSFITSSDASITVTADTVKFDTVFVNTGSVTQQFKIVNTNDRKLLISSIRLAGADNSVFKLNIDGAAAQQVKNIEIAANDSIYIFVSVFVNPGTVNQPFILRDSIEITFNSNKRQVQLQAYGQNAHFLNPGIIEGQVTWKNDLPYVILGGLLIDTGAKLTIEKGARIYFHANAPFLVYGTLEVDGASGEQNKVIFQSDRLDLPYSDFPGSWPGIYFTQSSKDNVLKYATIRNAYQGLIAEDVSVNANPKLLLSECIVDNIYDAGILAANSSITAENCLVSNCGRNIVLGYGGSYSFTYCTVATYSNDFLLHKDPVLNLSNYAVQGSTVFSQPLKAVFTNCIFWGSGGTVDDEVIVSKQSSSPSDVEFYNCLWKAKNDPSNIDIADGILKNQDPLFDSVNNQKRVYDFHLKDNSPVIGKGKSVAVNLDLDGNPRTSSPPDLGCYEKN